MKLIAGLFVRATLLLSVLLPVACASVDTANSDADDSEIDMDAEENVAVAASALSDSQGIRAFSESHQLTPALSVGRGAGTIPDVCYPGETAFLGSCWKGLQAWPARCPSGKEWKEGVCYDQCPLGYGGVGPVCHLDKIDQAACDALYSPTLAAEARNSHRALTFGIGAGFAVGYSSAVETGVYYGEDGQYGCYTSICQGVETDIAVELYGSFGNYNSVDAFSGDGFDVGASGGVGPFGFAQSFAFNANGALVGSTQQVSFGEGLAPVSVGASTCDTQLLELSGPGPALLNAPDPRPGNTLYRIDPDGNLELSHQAPNGAWDVVYDEIGWGWGGLRQVFAAEGGHLYTLDSAGTLTYFHHDNAGEFDDWDGVVIGQGWGAMQRVFAARFGEIYAIDQNGTLRIYRHDANFQFENWNGTIIGTGWNLPQVFSGGHGALYAIDSNGDLLYYYHDDSNQWVHTAVKIGSGWGGFASVASTGAGEIYAVTPAGDLLLYRHGIDLKFVPGSGGTVGTGWSFGSRGILPAAY